MKLSDLKAHVTMRAPDPKYTREEIQTIDSELIDEIGGGTIKLPPIWGQWNMTFGGPPGPPPTPKPQPNPQ